MTRAFVAVKLPTAVLDAVSAATETVNVAGARKTTRAQWHLTLQFLGDDADIDAVASALANFDVPGGRIRIGGAGAFPNARQGRVLWIGLAEGADVLARLALAVADRLTPLGYEADERPFRPHLTIARSARPADLRATVAAIGAGPIGDAWKLDALVVYESQLRPEGARYVERASVALPS